jgi:hypothetical protein
MQVLLQLFVQREEMYISTSKNQLHVEQSWRGSPSQEIPSDLWDAKINYRLNIINIPYIETIVYFVLKKGFKLTKI